MSEPYQDSSQWTDMEKEYKADDEGIEAEKNCGCGAPDISTWLKPKPMHHFSIATSSGEVAYLNVPRDITLADWQELERILNVLKPKQKRQRRKKA